MDVYNIMNIKLPDTATGFFFQILKQQHSQHLHLLEVDIVVVGEGQAGQDLDRQLSLEAVS